MYIYKTKQHICPLKNRIDRCNPLLSGTPKDRWVGFKKKKNQNNAADDVFNHVLIKAWTCFTSSSLSSLHGPLSPQWGTAD